MKLENKENSIKSKETVKFEKELERT